MLDLFNLPTPQGCDIQTFYGGGQSLSSANTKSWVKPRGVSNIYMLLIGAGGNGDGTTGGGSGAVTVWYGSANNIPDNLKIQVGSGITSIYSNQLSTGGINLLTAAAASGSTAGAAMAASNFTAMGFFQSIAGQAGTSAAGISASTSTFLGGGCANGGATTGNYGYSNNAPGAGGSRDGFFIMQPIIVGVGGTAAARGGIGCGGGSQGGLLGIGGPGMVLIASW